MDWNADDQTDLWVLEDVVASLHSVQDKTMLFKAKCLPLIAFTRRHPSIVRHLEESGPRLQRSTL